MASWLRNSHLARYSRSPTYRFGRIDVHDNGETPAWDGGRRMQKER